MKKKITVSSLTKEIRDILVSEQCVRVCLGNYDDVNISVSYGIDNYDSNNLSWYASIYGMDEDNHLQDILDDDSTHLYKMAPCHGNTSLQALLKLRNELRKAVKDYMSQGAQEGTIVVGGIKYVREDLIKK